MAEFCIVERKINTLEDSLKQFDMDCLLEQLDISLEHARKNKEAEENHLLLLRSVDKNLLKLSQTHHPDKAIRDKKSDREIEKAKKMQVALNATRAVLKALTKAFLEDIDIHYRYDFFAKMDISTLINEEEMDRQISNVLCKISHLSEVKRVNIVGEIRKFLLESRESLKSFLDNNKDEFERHRDYAICHFHKCIEGYEALATECKLIAEDCESENDGNTWEAIRRITHQSERELKILQKLKGVAERSLDGTLRIFSIYERADTYDYYLVSPFVLYINVMLMCCSVVNRKSKFRRKVESFTNFCAPNMYKTPHFDKEPTLFLKAYHLASYFNNETQYEREVEIMFRKKGLIISTNSIITEFKDAVLNIKLFLAEEFDLDTYKEGKSNREQFSEKLSKLNESMTGYKEEELKMLQEKLDLCKERTDEIRKEYSELSKIIEETEQENILTCINTSEKITRLAFSCNQKEVAGIRNFNQNNTRENERCNDAEETPNCVEHPKLLDCLTHCTQNITKIKEDQSSIDSRNDCSPVTEGEVGKRIEESYELHKKISKQSCYLLSPTPTKSTKNGNTAKGNLLYSTKLNYDSIVDKIRERSDSHDAQYFDSSASGQNVTENAKVIKISPSFKPSLCPFQEKDCGDLQKKLKVEESGDMSKHAKLKETFNEKDNTEMAKSHILSNKEDTKNVMKIRGTKRPNILNENKQKYDNKNHEGGILIYLPIDSISSECSIEEMAEECEEHFQKVNLDKTVKSDEAVKDGKGADPIETRKEVDSKNHHCEELLSHSSDSRNAEISAICVKAVNEIKKIADRYDTQFYDSPAIKKYYRRRSE